MYEGTRDEERGIFIPPPLSDDESNGEQDAAAEALAVDGEELGGIRTTFRFPVWLQESSKSFRWRWVPLPLRKAVRATARWVKGPDPPRDLLFKPLFPSIQELPVKYLNRFFPKRRHKIALLLLLYFSWFLSWFLVLLHSSSSGHIEGYGRPQPISCSASYWASGNQCGLNGNDCRPFSSSKFSFRCPANCKSTILLEPHTVGNQTLNYEPLVVGGPTPDSSLPGIYRADSFICQAAIHAGVVSNAAGGCGVVTLEGAAHSYPSVSQNGLTSIGFPSTFPKSFSFVRLSPSQATCPQDPRWPLLGITVAAVVILSIFTTSPPVFFFSTFFILILHVGLVSDPPNLPTLTDLFSLMLSRLLPASFIAYVLYLYCARPLLTRVSSPTYQLSRTILYLTPAFIGALNNYTFAVWIPLQRLTPHDLQEQPGAKLALAIVVSIIICIALTQAWYIRLAGLMPRYLKVYLAMGAILLVLLPLPGLRLRIHHYILAMLLMPGTAIPTRPSLIYQGLLLGLFVNGVARWGFASIIETPAALGEDPRSPRGGWWGATSPNITASSVTIELEDAPQIMHHKYRGNGNITIDLWEPERMAELGVDGVSVLVNDVERWRGYLDEDREGKFTWHRHGHRGLELVSTNIDLNKPSSTETAADHDADEPEDLFFRFAFLRGAEAGRYGGVGVWTKDGSWIPPPPPPPMP
ncbi:LCCL domain protein [Rasamsonia emersonii CBS 393.64]|uniref:LCCL domain protein n=1 Tax=Rasamsonia emersonii (strain ATCC 16479 / CBS 393.64 / IMI 116815) TaxID=1408163 RepID=A0A0F4YLR9_RASE3|nr:LCCL domain protein [Rasamsonia emersonii CBS 393.64]KKA18801.1 LCCL domain protein [Rasamsonia emersonii CBS 393.64]